MNIEKHIPLDINVEKLLQGCESSHNITATDIAEYNARLIHKKHYLCTWQRIHRDEQNAKRRVYRAVFSDVYNAQCRAYYAAHRDKIKARQRAYYSAHSDEIKAKKRAYYVAHREERKIYLRAYREAHRDEINAKKRATYAAAKERVQRSESMSCATVAMSQQPPTE